MNPMYSQFLLIAIIIGVFYFLVIKPQQKRAKQQRDMVGSIKPGDEIVTIGGIYATVVEVGERLRVRVASGSEMEVAKQAIGQVLAAKSDSAVEDSSADEAGEPDSE